MNATLTSLELTRADRCDRCGAAARVRAKLPSGAELLFCQHHANEHEVAREENSPFGKRYVIEGIMRAADGRTPMLRSVWFIESGADKPRFVTAYPLRREDDD